MPESICSYCGLSLKADSDKKLIELEARHNQETAVQVDGDNLSVSHIHREFEYEDGSTNNGLRMKFTRKYINGSLSSTTSEEIGSPDWEK